MQCFSFTYNNLGDVRQKALEFGIELPLSENISVLSKELKIGGKIFHNRLGAAPMEGVDGTFDGSPSEVTLRKYIQKAKGGSTLIWFEATAVVPEGRSSEKQLYLNCKNLDKFKQLVSQTKEAGLKTNGFEPVIILQATHSGIYSYQQNQEPISDEYLRKLEDKFAESTKMAKEAGFDGIDIKCCHGYLFEEIFTSKDRQGLYGGDFEGRTRLLRNSIMAAKAFEDENFIITSRIGMNEETVRLVECLHNDMGIQMVSLTMGDPHVTPHISRPYDNGKYCPDEHPFVGLNRMIQSTGKIKRVVPGMTIWASAPSYLRQFAGNYAAGAINADMCDGMLFGRMSVVNPEYANELLDIRKY